MLATVVSLPLRHRVLVVEDDYLLAEELRAQLTAIGADVLGPVASLDGALDLLAKGPAPDIAILDINLGGQMVYPLADSLRERGIFFIFATGYDVWGIPDAYADVPRCEKPFDAGRCLRLLLGQESVPVAGVEVRGSLALEGQPLRPGR